MDALPELQQSITRRESAAGARGHRVRVGGLGGGERGLERLPRRRRRRQDGLGERGARLAGLARQHQRAPRKAGTQSLQLGLAPVDLTHRSPN